jgi:hypothetical protein
MKKHPTAAKAKRLSPEEIVADCSFSRPAGTGGHLWRLFPTLKHWAIVAHPFGMKPRAAWRDERSLPAYFNPFGAAWGGQRRELGRSNTAIGAAMEPYGLGRRTGRVTLGQLGEAAAGLDYAVVSKTIARFGQGLGPVLGLRQQLVRLEQQLSK